MSECGFFFRIVKVTYELRLNLHLLSATINNVTEFKAKQGLFYAFGFVSFAFSYLEKKNYHVDCEKRETKKTTTTHKITRMYVCCDIISGMKKEIKKKKRSSSLLNG